MAQPKEHSVVVSITSTSGDLINQEILCTEYASDAQELVTKHMTIAGEVVGAVTSAMAILASQDFTVPGKGDEKRKR